MIEKDKSYRIKGESEYFKKKYGTCNPIIEIEDKDTDIWAGGWGVQNGNPCCMLYAIRSGFANMLHLTGQVWYGHINIKKDSPIRLAELVHETELEEI
jgi:hypothetical protein